MPQILGSGKVAHRNGTLIYQVPSREVMFSLPASTEHAFSLASPWLPDSVVASLLEFLPETVLPAPD